ncbi:ATP-binding cassette domain-containing protein [Brochothrix campestris]|uniref:ATP-binding cassette domain-containing protein n=1 Tax=Brochothrix campestris TaxID=2757 RepID=UPI0018DE4B6F|nr:ATP-binding cassette domain-containing protein [Brochothrix campestris]
MIIWRWRLATRFSPLKKQGRLLAYREAIEQVGLRGDFLLKKVHTLSGGEQQGVALARLLLTKPRIVFADEPTGNLDNANRDLVFKLLKRIAQQGTPVIYASHDPVLIADAQEVIQLPL